MAWLGSYIDGDDVPLQYDDDDDDDETDISQHGEFIDVNDDNSQPDEEYYIRAEQTKQLQDIIEPTHDGVYWVHGVVHIWGNHCTGKKTTLFKVLERISNTTKPHKKRIMTVFLDCNQFTKKKEKTIWFNVARDLLTQQRVQLIQQEQHQQQRYKDHGMYPRRNNNTKRINHVEIKKRAKEVSADINDFLNLLRQSPVPIALVFDNAEQFSQFPPTAAQSLYQLFVQTNGKVCVFFVSHVHYIDIFPAPNAALDSPPHEIYFPQYTTDELVAVLKIMARKQAIAERIDTDAAHQTRYGDETMSMVIDETHIKPEDADENNDHGNNKTERPNVSCYSYADEELFDKFVRLVVESLFFSTRDVKEIHLIATQLYPLYKSKFNPSLPISSQLGSLLANIKPELRKMANMISQRGDLKYGNKRGKKKINNTGLSSLQCYIIVAAYLAAHNPDRYDSRFFAHVCKGEKKSTRTKAATAEGGPEGGDAGKKKGRTGPKAFSVERLLAIISSLKLGQESFRAGSEVLSKINTLVSLKLLSSEQSDPLAVPKFTCNMSYEFVCEISNSIGIDIGRYLYYSNE